MAAAPKLEQEQVSDSGLIVFSSLSEVRLTVRRTHTWTRLGGPLLDQLAGMLNA